MMGWCDFAVAARGNMKQRRRAQIAAGPREDGIAMPGQRNCRWLNNVGGVLCVMFKFGM